MEMEVGKTLIMLGLWEERTTTSRWRHPRDFVREKPFDDVCQLVHYLRSGVLLNQELGYSHCRFVGGPPDCEMGSGERSDGVWIWPEGLWVYIEQFRVDLPVEFVSHVRRRKFSIPAELRSRDLERMDVDFEWWRSWQQRLDLTRIDDPEAN